MFFYKYIFLRLKYTVYILQKQQIPNLKIFPQDIKSFFAAVSEKEREKKIKT